MANEIIKTVSDQTEYIEVKLNTPLDIKQGGEADSDGLFRFEALASTFDNVDLVDDVMVKGCFAESLRNETPVILWQHDRHEPIGMPEFIAEIEEGLHVKAIMPASDTFVKGRVMPQLRIRSIKAMSIGFRVLEFFIKDGIRFITKCILKEISLVTFAANTEARITSVKAVGDFQDGLPFAPRSHPWISADAINRVRTATGSTDKPSTSYKNNFLWWDGENTDSFGAYKLPFVDIIDGKRIIVPRALFAARAALQGARGGVNIPESEKPQVVSLVNRYIDKLDKIEPVKMYEADDIEKMTKRDLEKALRESGTFNKPAAVLIASRFPESGELPTDDDDAIVKAVDELFGTKSENDSEAEILKQIESMF